MFKDMAFLSKTKRQAAKNFLQTTEKQTNCTCVMVSRISWWEGS